MNYLLDSHTLLWTILDKSKLSDKVLKALEDQQNTVFVSSVSFWEISIKYALKKLELNGIVPSDLPELATESGFKLLDLHTEESSNYYQLPLTTHRDPFDRMLIWQAIQLNLTLVSKDSRLQEYAKPGLKTLW